MNTAGRAWRVGSLGVLAAASASILWAACAQASERGPAIRAVATAAPEREARVIVKFKADSALMRALSIANAAASGATVAGAQHAQALSARLGLALVDGLAIGPRTQVVKGVGLSSEALAAQLGAQSDVEYAVVDGRRRAVGVTANDPLYPPNSVQSPAAGQWYLQVPGTTLAASTGNTDPLVSAINVEAAWAVTSGKSSVVIADLDTGIRPDHPDFAGKLLGGYSFISDPLASGDGLGRHGDAADPGDYVLQSDVGTVSGCTSADVGPSSWHGTQTAGILAAATNNGLGMASVGRDVMLLPVRVLGKCGGYDSDIIAAMLWAAGISVPGVPDNTHPANVINMSLGGPGASTVCTAPAGTSGSYEDAITQVTARNVVVVVAAGNEGMAVDVPGNCPGVITVGGVRHTGTKVGYSNLGPEITISAPAGNCVNGAGLPCLYPILTTSNTGTNGPLASKYTGGGTDASLGTSFATPLVTGTVALMISTHAGLTPAAVKAALQATARPFPPPAGVALCTAPTSVAQNECACSNGAASAPLTCGSGLLDAGAAVQSVATVTANIVIPSTNDLIGNPVTLDGSQSTPANGITYAWAITAGSDIATITSSTTASTATVLPTAAGTVTISLTVTDAQRQTSDTTTSTLNVTTAPVTPPPTSSGGGGGGAMELGWLIGWLASVIGVWVVTPRRKRHRGGKSTPPARDREPGDEH